MFPTLSTSPFLQAITGKTIEDTIESEMSGDFKRGLLALVHVARSKVDYFAARLYDSMKVSIQQSSEAALISQLYKRVRPSVGPSVGPSLSHTRVEFLGNKISRLN